MKSNGAELQLSPAELDVLKLSARGYGDGRIAVIRGVSLRTVKAQMQAVRDKLDTVSRTGAVVIAHQLELIDLDEIDVERRSA